MSCKLRITSLSTELSSIAVNGVLRASLVDNLGNEYQPTVIATDADIGIPNPQFTSVLQLGLTQGIPIDVELIYDNFSIHATSISLFKPLILNFRNRFVRFFGNFRDIIF